MCLKDSPGPPNSEKTLSHREVSAQKHPWPGSLTWPIGSGFLWVQFGPQGSPWLQLGLGELGQVGHDGVFINVGVHDLLGGDHLSQTKDRSHMASEPQVPSM